METVFDHNIAKDEIKALFYFNVTEHQYLSFLSECTDDKKEKIVYGHLYSLYCIRGEKEKALQFANQIKTSFMLCLNC